jgi:hypothetical protein
MPAPIIATFFIALKKYKNEGVLSEDNLEITKKVIKCILEAIFRMVDYKKRMCDMGKISLWKSALAIAGLAFGLSSASSVAVHDPSVVLVYKDASGNSYPEQDASKSRTKYYYIFGTMGGAAYSKDLINWTEFTPTYLANGTLSTDFSKIVSVGATWSGWTTASDAQTN